MASSSVSIDADRLHDAEATIQLHLDWLAALDEITKDDLEALRQDLPTDPLLAEAL